MKLNKKLTLKIFQKWFTDYREFGGGLVESIVAVGIIGIGVQSFLYLQKFKADETVKLNKSADKSQLANYLLNTVDCRETASANDYALRCNENQSVSLLDAKRNIVINAGGSRISKYTVTAVCNRSKISLFAAEDGKAPESINDSIPIVCPAPAQCAANTLSIQRLSTADCNAISARIPSIRCAVVADDFDAGGGGATPSASHLCRASIQKTDTSGRVDQVLLNGVPRPGTWNGNQWTSEPFDCGPDSIAIKAELAAAPVLRPPNDSVDLPVAQCGEVIIPAAEIPPALTCKLRLIQGDLAYWTAAPEQRPQLVVKVTSNHDVQTRPTIIKLGAGEVVSQGTSWTRDLVQGKACHDPPCLRVRFDQRDVWMPGEFEVNVTDVNGTTGTCKAYNYSCWDTTWRGGRQAYWLGGPLVKDFARRNNALSNPPNGPGTGSVAYDAATLEQLCKWTGLKPYFASTKSSENRDNYTSCGDDQHLKWNPTLQKIVAIPACNSNWTGCLLCN